MKNESLNSVFWKNISWGKFGNCHYLHRNFPYFFYLLYRNLLYLKKFNHYTYNAYIKGLPIIVGAGLFLVVGCVPNYVACSAVSLASPH